MNLSTLQILTLSSLNLVGKTKILKIGCYIQDMKCELSSWEDFVPLLESLKIKTKDNDKKGCIKIELKHLLEAEKKAKFILESCIKQGIGVSSYYDDDFPHSLRNTINEDGKLDPPIIIFYKGDFSITKSPGVAIIGTREVSDFGAKAGMYVSQEFAKRGFNIVSGLAIGCDTIGHRGALSVEGKTIAILGHGLDSVYPAENTELAQQIVDNGGVLLSEYPIGIEVNRYNLVARDRLQAALSLATVVIQTGEQGGTMHAANATLKSSKPLYVLKFQSKEQNEHDKSLGNALLVNKGAKYISGSDNIDNIAEEIRNYKKPMTSLFE